MCVSSVHSPFFQDASSRCKVFIGGLNINTTKESLTSYFEQFGEIVDAVVMRDPTTKRSRGFGFVTYGDGKCLEECLKECPHTVGEYDNVRLYVMMMVQASWLERRRVRCVRVCVCVREGDEE